MRLSGLIRLSRAAVLLALAGAASPLGVHAEDRDCRGFGSLSEAPPPVLAEIGSGEGRVSFYRDGSDLKGCPAMTAACRAKAFVVPGDRVIQARTERGFACVDYIGRKGADRAGWLAADRVIPTVVAPVAIGDWLGDWSREEASITIKAGKATGTLSVHGDATYGSLDPDRVKRGAVNVGEIDGVRAPDGPALSFAVGDKATLPVDKAEEGDCKVWLRRLGPYLLADDNLLCGGMNVSFRGVYTRKP